MQNLMVRDGLGKRRDLGNPRKARDWAASELRIAKSVIVFMSTSRESGGHDVWWCRPDDSEYFQNVLKSEGLEVLHIGCGADIGSKR